MEAAVGPVASLVGKVSKMLSDSLVAAYVDSLELGHNSDQIKAKLLHTIGLLHKAQGSDIGHNPGLPGLLLALSRNADQAEDLLDEIHYFQIHDRLHGTNYAATEEAGQVRHVRSTLRHTVGGLLQCFSCSPTQDGADDSANVAGDPRSATNSASADGSDRGDKLQFDRVSVSRKIKSVLQDMQSNCGSVSDLLHDIPSTSTEVVIHRLPTASRIIQDTLYGRKDTFEETVNRMTSGKQIVSVLIIAGPGGIGKTTFAQHLYNDARVYNAAARAEGHFEVRVWVCVSTDFDVLKLTREILDCILATEGGSNNVPNGTTNLDQLQKSIAHRLKSKRFLIVLDDIWKCGTEDQWKTLLAPFTEGEVKGSMVLVTTRFPKLAQIMKTTELIKLAGLESSDFFTFFESCIFGENKPDHYEYELAGIARQIANKLKGSPLAAKTVGRLLWKNLSQDHWNGVLHNNEWLKQKNKDDIMPSLKISYDYLPFDLKKLFPYFGLFPEDHRFDNSEMNHLFVAVGVTESTHQAERNYLEELVGNGFLMKGADDGHEYYVLHDLMHELSRRVSTQECLNISDLDFKADDIPQSVRHLSITIENRYDEKFEEEMCRLRGRIDIANLRTLLIFKEYEERIAKRLKDCFKTINSLRILFIVVNTAESFPHRFPKLIHLQYLKISSSYNNRAMTLPCTLSRFHHLKFLDLNDWHSSSDLPEDFSHLENLHDFRAKSEFHSNIRYVGNIKHLQRLKEFHVKKSMGFELRELGSLTELGGELSIYNLEKLATKEEASAAKLLLKRNLKNLELAWDRQEPLVDADIDAPEPTVDADIDAPETIIDADIDAPETVDADIDAPEPSVDADILEALQPHSNLRVLAIANHGGSTGPSWLCFDIWLTSLETLTLEGVSWSTLPPFGKLPNLKVLELKRISGMRQFGAHCGGAPGKCFVHLKTIGFHEMPDLAEWVVEPNCHSFPSLEIIECVDCPNLRGMPFSDVSCANLCKLGVSGCPKMSLPSMPHTSTLIDLDVKRGDSEMLSYTGDGLFINKYGGALAFHNLDKAEDVTIQGVSHISLADIEKLKVLRVLNIGRCNGLFPEELDSSFVLPVKRLRLHVSHLTSKSSSKLLNCFPALSDLTIVGDFAFHSLDKVEECVMQFPSSSSLQTLIFEHCEGLVLVPVENGGGIQEDNSSLMSLSIRAGCGELFSRWPMGDGAQAIYPFPASLRELYVEGVPSMKSMALLSNLTSLTSLTLIRCRNLSMDGFNPVITVNLKKLAVYVGAADLLSEVARTKLLPAGYISRLEELTVHSISGLLVAPTCILLAPALRKLIFYKDEQAESFTEEQEKALQLLTSLQDLTFCRCMGLQSLPQGLHRLSSLEILHVRSCFRVKSLPMEGFPVSLRVLRMKCHTAQMREQIEKIKRTNPDLTVTDQ